MKRIVFFLFLLFSVKAYGAPNIDSGFCNTPQNTTFNVCGIELVSDVHLFPAEDWLITATVLLSILRDRLAFAKSQNDKKKVEIMKKAIEKTHANQQLWRTLGANHLEAELSDMNDKKSVPIRVLEFKSNMNDGASFDNPIRILDFTNNLNYEPPFDIPLKAKSVINESSGVSHYFRWLGVKVERILLDFEINNGITIKGDFYFIVRKAESQHKPEIKLIFNLQHTLPFLTANLLKATDILKPYLATGKKYFYIFKCTMTSGRQKAPDQ